MTSLVLRGAIADVPARNTRSAAPCSRKTVLCGYGTSRLLLIVERRNLHLLPIGLATELIAVVWDFFRVTSSKTGKYTTGALRKWSTFTKGLRVPQRSVRMSEILAAVRQSLFDTHRTWERESDSERDSEENEDSLENNSENGSDI